MPEPRPRFATLLQQAKEQCRKEFYVFDEITVMFFASGMEYRLSRELGEVERAFLSSYNRAEFLMGYLQGKDADEDMINKLHEECFVGGIRLKSSYLTDIFEKGIWYENHILNQMP